MSLLRKEVQIVDVVKKTLKPDFLPADREYAEVVLIPGEGRKIRFYISRPKKRMRRKLPVVFLLGGWRVNLDTFKLIPEPGEYILVIYRYGYRFDDWKNTENKAAEIFRVQNAILSLPRRVLSAVAWIVRQEGNETQQISLAGVSLGALFVPAIYHLANEEGIRLGKGVVAFGGADLERLFAHNIVKYPLAAKILAMMVHPIEPALHMPFLYQEMLFINATEDEKIPLESARLLHRLKPDPKKIIWLDTEHIQPSRQEIVRKVVDITMRWLEQKERATSSD